MAPYNNAYPDPYHYARRPGTCFSSIAFDALNLSNGIEHKPYSMPSCFALGHQDPAGDVADGEHAGTDVEGGLHRRREVAGGPSAPVISIPQRVALGLSSGEVADPDGHPDRAEEEADRQFVKPAAARS
jgi:hypothetical protein